MNTVQITGRLVRDIELRQAGSYNYARFSVAVDKPNAKKLKGEGKPTADFINCVVWRQSAEFLSKYAQKGSRIGIVGTLVTNSYTGQDGQKRTSTEVSVNNVEILDGFRQAGGQTTAKPAQANTFEDSDTVPYDGGELDFSSDDIPF